MSSGAICWIRRHRTRLCETLLHAFMPHKFVDHTHSTAVLALTDQPDGAAICRDVYGDTARSGVPYIMPGFALARSCASYQQKKPGCRRPDPSQARDIHLW